MRVDPVGNFSDEPIQNVAEDRLARSLFAQSLAAVLSGWTGETSLVIGLHAPWGEGKTSLINLVSPRLEKEGFRVLRFSPWEWASRADLNDAFFDEIAIQLGHSSRRETVEIAKAWRRYATRLKGGVKTVTLMLPVFKLALALSVFLTVSGLVWPSRVFTVAILAVVCFTGITAWAASLFPAVADLISPSDKASGASLEHIRGKLKKELAAWTGRVLVVIDDVDRVDPQQTADVLRLVKANGDLPRISYLLVGDRQIIADHIGKNLSVNGNAYLEKIIQLSFDLPLIDQIALNGMFFEGLSSVLAAPGVDKDFDAARWARVFWSAVAPSISSLRSVKRLMATLQFHFAMLNGEAAFEVNSIDLVALETMRIFEPGLYRAIRRSKSLLLERTDNAESGDQLAEKTLGLLLENSVEEHRQDWKSCLKILFPLLNSQGGRVHVGPDTLRSWDRERRVCSKTFFERYFSFGIRDGELSESSFQSFFGSATREAFRDSLFSFVQQELLPTVVDRLRSRVKEVPLDKIEPMVAALFDACDSLSSTSAQMFGISALTTCEFTIDELLKRLDQNDVQSVLEHSFSHTSGLKLPVEFLRRRGMLQKEGRLEYPIDVQSIENWQKTMVAAIAQASTDSRLMGRDGSILNLHLWAEWGDFADVRQAVERSLNSRESALEFLKGMVVIAHSSNPNKSGGTERPYIRHSDISKYVDPEKVYTSLHINGDRDAELIRRIHPEFVYFEKALRRFRSGQSDDGFHTADDEDD